MNSVFSHYNQVITLVEAEFDRNVRLYGDRMQCGRGCSSCCSQMFRITIMDAIMISRKMKQLPAAERDDLQARAQHYIEERARLIHQRADEDNQNEREVPTTGLRLPCPALNEQGACRIYDARPVVCRKWGIPLFDPQHPTELQACELNFPPGTAFEDEELDELIDRQTEIAERWQAVKASVNDRYQPKQTSTTIAEAIAGDYEEMMKRKLARGAPCANLPKP
jgi:Fe-S-cluster containining protein